MISTLGTVTKPSFLTLIASISPHKSFQRHARLLASRPPAFQKSHYQTRLTQFTCKSDQVSTSCSQQVRPFQRPEPQYRTRAVIFRYRSSSSNASNAPNTQRDNLPSEDEGQRSHLSRKFSHLMDNVQSNIFFAGQRLNDLTGYSGIEALKRDIEEQERNLQTIRNSLQQAREAYSATISQRSASQREVNELLQRKHAWAPSDLERFTALYRSDHANEQAESMAKEQLESIERKAEEAASRLSASILARYHEEQIWSDKIRRMSTWGTWGLMGVNVLLFLVFQVLIEPWRRKRLVIGFEDKVMEALAEREAVPVGIITKIETEMSSSSSQSSAKSITPVEQKSGNDLIPEPTDAVEEKAVYVARPTAGEELALADVSKSRSVVEYAKNALQDPFSHRQIMMRRLDITVVALESAAIGMATVGLAIIIFLRRP